MSVCFEPVIRNQEGSAVVNEKEVISKFLSNSSDQELNEVLSTFVAIYSLDDSNEGDTGRKLAFEEPEKFVLKPQREGGEIMFTRKTFHCFWKNWTSKSGVHTFLWS